MSSVAAEPRSGRARALLDYVTGAADHPYARLDKTDFAGPLDVVDLTVEPELPQDRTVPIIDAEPIRLSFPADDTGPPVVRSRRADFPLDLVHTVQTRDGGGTVLCVWEENWADLARNLTAQALVERIRGWFAQTARGELHQPGQPLEALVPETADTVVVPPGPPAVEWHVTGAWQRDGRWTVLLGPEPAEDAAPGAPRFPIFQVRLPPQVHGALRARPDNLEALRSLVEPNGVDLARELGDWLARPAQLEASDRRMILLVSAPKRRHRDGDVETVETWAFTPSEELRGLGAKLGRTLYDPETKQTAPRLGVGQATELDKVGLFGWRVVQRLDRAAARALAGGSTDRDRKLVAIGAGAIGSNIVLNAARAGAGTWTIVDDDEVLSHNTVRQVHDDGMVGWPKAEATSFLVNRLLADESATAIRANVLAPGDHAGVLGRALAEADLVADFSASPAVLGRLADEDRVRRAASFFFDPGGRDLVVLAEDDERTLRLDEIEARYFLAAATNPLLDGHLGSSRPDLVRYANACRDLSRPLPPWRVQALSGIAAGRLVALLGDGGAAAGVWRLDPDGGAVNRVPLALPNVRRFAFDHFRATVSDETLATMRELRRRAAPNETGGVLVGTFDLSRAVVHVVAALPAPPDSRQAPTYFVRGAKDLKPAVDRLASRSAGALHYLGEWHSHPDRAAARPSADDEDVFRYLQRHLDPAGYPYVMAICGTAETWIRVGWRGHPAGEKTMAHGR